MKLVGYVDGIEVNFNFYPPNTFKAIIPKRLNGKYIVELKATDEAGNQNSSTSIIVYIDFQKMHFKVLDDKYKFNINNSKLGYMKVEDLFSAVQLTEKFNFKEVYSQFSYRELVVR